MHTFPSNVTSEPLLRTFGEHLSGWSMPTIQHMHIDSIRKIPMHLAHLNLGVKHI